MIPAALSGWVIETLVASTLLMGLVLCLRGPVCRAFGPHMAYALWLLPVLRMVMPPVPASWREQAAAPVAAASDVIVYYVVEPIAGIAGAGEAPPVASGIDWLLVVGIAWAAGALMFLAYHLITHLQYCRNLLARARMGRTVAEGRVRVIETDAAHGPLAFGIFRKYVAFPRDFAERYDEQERDLALAHELGHHVRGDLIANWVALIVLAIHWFNPLAWSAFRAFRADQEMACDALVLAGRALALRHAYGRAIVKSAHGGAVSAACHLHTINEVKGRLRMLSKTGKASPARIAIGLVGVSAVGLAALGLTASGSRAAEQIKTRVEAATGVHLVQAAPRAAPEAAEPHVAAQVQREWKHARKETAKEVASAMTQARADIAVVVAGAARARAEAEREDLRRIEMVHADGERRIIEVPDRAKILSGIPDVQRGKCDGGGAATIARSVDGVKQIVTVCSDRIAKLTHEAHLSASINRRIGAHSALVSLRQARATILADHHASRADQQAALEGIEEAISELETQSAENG